MPRNLYFIPILDRAMAVSPVETALQKAFEEIGRLGQLERYAQGYKQFLTFMDIVRRNIGVSATPASPMDSPTGDVGFAEDMVALLNISDADTPLKRQQVLEEIQSILADPLEPAETHEFVLQKGTTTIQTFILGPSHPVSQVVGVTPGRFRLITASGRVLWEEDLRRNNLYWTDAFPGEPLPFAAATGESPFPSPAQERVLLDGELVVRIKPQLESGTIEFTLHRPPGSR